jgi:hypothetical protein
LSQHAEVPFDALVGFFLNQKFNPSGNYNPKRAQRVEWFSDKWNLG